VGLNWPETLEQILAGEDLSRELARAALVEILEGETESAVIAAFLTALRAKGESIAETAGLVEAMLEMAVSVPLDGPLLDTCGTGGDRSGSVNISTMAGFVCAAAGVRVAKHGNRSASSQCGSADVLEALGAEIVLSPEGVAACVEETGIGFMFAPTFHPALKHVMPVRRALKIRTIFNVLGPLANPARATHQLVGVADPSLGKLVAEVLNSLGKEHAVVVHGAGGLDEVSTLGPNRMWRVQNGTVAEEILDPAKYGLTLDVPVALVGGDAGENAAIVRKVFAGMPGPVRDIVLLNAAVGLWVANRVPDVESGLLVASAAIDDGCALACLHHFIEVSHRVASS